MNEIIGNLPTELRQEGVVAVLAQRGFARVSELSARFGVSSVTIRHDLAELERRGVARRVRGGATAKSIALAERPFEEVEMQQRSQKQAIGRVAAAMIRPGEAVLLDVGTTTVELARALVERTDLDALTVLTNGLNVAMALERAADRIDVVVTGGTLRPAQHSLVNPLATSMLDQLQASTVFLGCNGVDPVAGITNVNLPETEVKRAMVRISDRTVVVADSSKIGAVAFAQICTVSEVDVLVTDRAADEATLDQLAQRGVEIVIADD